LGLERRFWTLSGGVELIGAQPCEPLPPVRRLSNHAMTESHARDHLPQLDACQRSQALVLIGLAEVGCKFACLTADGLQCCEALKRRTFCVAGDSQSAF
jgi:hypothetical protein